jgi:hypothetical protein
LEHVPWIINALVIGRSWRGVERGSRAGAAVPSDVLTAARLRHFFSWDWLHQGIVDAGTREARMGSRLANKVWGCSATAMMLAGLAASAQANDRGVRGVMIPAAACNLVVGSATLTDIPNWTVRGGASATITCPLPINNVNLGGTDGDNDITKFRVLYRDTDGSGSQAALTVTLFKSKVSNGTLTTTQVCRATLATTSTAFTATTVTCAHDVAGGGTFYSFGVLMTGLGTREADFTGIDFPQ